VRLSIFPLIASTLSAQPSLQFTPPPNWNSTPGNLKAFVRTDGPTFAQLAVYDPAATTGDPVKDSAADFKSIVSSKYTIRSTASPVITNLPNGWRLTVTTSEVSFPATGNFSTVLHTFSGPTHRLTALSSYNSDRYRPELNASWQSLRPTDRPTTSSNWTLNPEAESVRFTQANNTVFVYYPISITDRLHPGDLVDAFWAHLVDPAFRTLNRTKLRPEAYSSAPANFSSGYVDSNVGRRFAALIVLANTGRYTGLAVAAVAARLELTPDSRTETEYDR